MLQGPSQAQESVVLRAARRTEMAEFLAGRTQTVLSQAPHAGRDPWPGQLPAPPTPRERFALSALRTSPQSPSLLLARPNASLPPAFPDDTGSLGGLTQPSQGSMRSALDALLVSGRHQEKGG